MSIGNKQYGRIGILMGGVSSEREISLMSGRGVSAVFQEAGFDVIAIDIQKNEKEKIMSKISSMNIDVAFITLHGELGEDGEIQRMLEEMRIPYTGSGPEASLKALDKSISQDIFKKSGLKVPQYLVLTKHDKEIKRTCDERINFFPVVIKPVLQGSSIGIQIIKKKEALLEGLKKAWQYGDKVLIEQFIQGREMTVGILNETALPVLEVQPHREYFDFTAKYEKGMSDYIVPAVLEDDVALRMQNEALEAHYVLGCKSLSRVDLILNEKNESFVLEINTIPGFTTTSLVPMAAHAAGINFQQLCIQLVERAYGQKKENKNTATFK